MKIVIKKLINVLEKLFDVIILNSLLHSQSINYKLNKSKYGNES
jgi:hypothetical protein